MIRGNWAGILLTVVLILAVVASAAAYITVGDTTFTNRLPAGLSGGAHPTTLLSAWWASFVNWIHDGLSSLFDNIFWG
jgi:hypothetical protein